MVSKVVLRTSSDGGIKLRIAPVPFPPPARTPAGSELHLGSQDLIRLAHYAKSHRFVVSSFMIADGYLVPLDPEEQAELSDEMVGVLRAYGVNELEAAMHDEYDGLYVVGVTLVSSSGSRLVIKRRGFIETSVVKEAEQLLQLAWREHQIS